MGTKITLEEISSYLNSQNFAKIIAKLDNLKLTMGNVASHYSEMMGVAIDYVETFGQSGNATIEEMEEILNIVVKKKNNNESYNLRDAFANKVLRDLGLKGKELSEDEMEQAKIKAIEMLGYRGATKYHGFNGEIKDSIKEHGLDPNKKLNMKEWDIINGLFQKYHIAGIKLMLSSDRSMVYYSNTPSNSYYYALKSPEWMTRLCGGTNFIDRNYEASRAEMNRIINEEHFSSEDAELLLKTFENCWKTFASGNKPCVVAVPNNIAHDEFHNYILRDKFCDMDFDKTFSILYSVKSVQNDIKDDVDTLTSINIVENSLSGSNNKDYLDNNYLCDNAPSYEKIDTSEAVFIDLPTLKELQKRIELARQTQQENSISA